MGSDQCLVRQGVELLGRPQALVGDAMLDDPSLVFGSTKAATQQLAGVSQASARYAARWENQVRALPPAREPALALFLHCHLPLEFLRSHNCHCPSVRYWNIVRYAYRTMCQFEADSRGATPGAV